MAARTSSPLFLIVIVVVVVVIVIIIIIPHTIHHWPVLKIQTTIPDVWSQALRALERGTLPALHVITEHHRANNVTALGILRRQRNAGESPF